MTPAIEIHALTKRFGTVVAVDNLDLSVPAGSVFGFLGANGAGKTTTIRAIAGLSRPTSGSVRVAGIGADAGRRYRRQFGYLCQEPAFYGWMTGRDVLRYAVRFHPDVEKPGQRIETLLRLVGLADAAERKVSGYSGGMRQRLGIAAALVGKPPVVVLDEPASGLDPIGRRDVLDIIAGLREMASTVFYSTHILDDVERVSDRVAVLDHGRLVATDRTADLLSSFTRNRLRVRLGGATAETLTSLAAISGVTSVAVEPDASGTFAFTLRIDDPEDMAGVQRAVTDLAATRDLTVIEARPVVLGLEEVFLHLVGDAQGHQGNAA